MFVTENIWWIGQKSKTPEKWFWFIIVISAFRSFASRKCDEALIQAFQNPNIPDKKVIFQQEPALRFIYIHNWLVKISEWDVFSIENLETGNWVCLFAVCIFWAEWYFCLFESFPVWDLCLSEMLRQSEVSAAQTGNSRLKIATLHSTQIWILIFRRKKNLKYFQNNQIPNHYIHC